MRRFVLALMVGAALALTAAAPVGAQYEEPPEEQPVEPRVVANITSADVEPGESVTVSAPPAFAPGSPITVNLVRARQGAGAAELASGTASETGAVSESITIPETESGVYFVYVTGVDVDGNPVVALVAIVIRNTATAAAADVETFQATAAAAPVPAAVAAAQQGVAPDTEAAVVDAVSQGAGVALSPQGTLQVRSAAGALQDADTLPRTGTSTDISQQVTIGAALLLAGTGLVLLRRRRGGFTK
ncbi:MAG: LPXTG cell wall anchor domain-containing protein [Acidimicrobiia bacterium]